MKKPHLSLPILLVLLLAGRALGADSIRADYKLPETRAGEKVTVPGTFTDTGKRQIRLVGPEIREIEATSQADAVSFQLPSNLKEGSYKVSILLGNGTTDVTGGELRVLPPEPPVSIEAVHAVSPYPNPQHKNKYDFEIIGANFSPDLARNFVLINKDPIILERVDSCTYESACLRHEAGSETRKLIVHGFDPRPYSRPLLVSVRVGSGDNVSKEMQMPVFSRVSETGVKLWSVVVFALVILAVFLLVRKGIRADRINNKSYGPAYAFLMDKETNSYSLSKFQLVLFTLVTVFGYIYVFLCRLLVQWNFELPPVPQNLPSMLAVSAGTTVVAAGITATRGTKGAGPIGPSAADFISSGGLVLPERFQFFVWTLVASLGLVAILLASDPFSLTQLPNLPDGMLYLMGLSSAGYLGGKLVRGPGPRITSIDASKVPLQPVVQPTGLKIELTGENLSQKATFQLDEKQVPADQTQIVAKEQQGQDADLCVKLTVNLSNVAETYLEGEHVFKIINPDGQAAEAKYGATIESIKDIRGGTNPTPVTVIGRNFKDPSNAVWTPPQPPAPAPAAPDDAIPPDRITKKSETELEVTLTPGTTTGEGVLQIISPGELTTRANAKVV
jgi:hypothetical protein